MCLAFVPCKTVRGARSRVRLRVRVRACVYCIVGRGEVRVLDEF